MKNQGSSLKGDEIITITFQNPINRPRKFHYRGLQNFWLKFRESTNGRSKYSATSEDLATKFFEFFASSSSSLVLRVLRVIESLSKVFNYIRSSSLELRIIKTARSLKHQKSNTSTHIKGLHIQTLASKVYTAETALIIP